MRDSTIAHEIDPLTSYIINSFDGSAPGLSQDQTRPIALEAESDNPFAPWTANRLSESNTTAGGATNFRNTRSPAPRQSNEDAYWELDEIQEDLVQLRSDRRQRQKPDLPNASEQILSTEAVSNTSFYDDDENSPGISRTQARLSFPIVIPQRRPKGHTKGFVKAYVPELGNHGVSATKFLELLDGLEEGEDYDEPCYITGINLASDGVSTPNKADWPMLVAVDLSGWTASMSNDPRATCKANRNIRTANNTIFQPIGLYCLALCYMPDSAEGSHRVDVLSPAVLHTSYKSSQSLRHIPAAIEKNHASTITVEAAQLVFPQLESFRDEPGLLAVATKDKPSKVQQLVHDYYSYSKDWTKLEANYKTETFSDRSGRTLMPRYAHPQALATTGSFMSLLSGQYVNAPPIAHREQTFTRGVFASERRLSEQDVLATAIDDAVRRTADLSMSSGLSDEPSRQEVEQNPSIAMTTLKKNLMYLVIVNMPSDEELATARQEVEKRQRKGTRFRRISTVI